MSGLFPINDDELLISVYQKQGRTLDDLPYTPAFDAIYEAMYGGAADAPSRREVFHRLHNLRKAGKLPRLGRAESAAPRIDVEHEASLIAIVQQEHGPISTRDQLPFTEAFDRVALRFADQSGLSLSNHDLWRVIAKLAK